MELGDSDGEDDQGGDPVWSEDEEVEMASEEDGDHDDDVQFVGEVPPPPPTDEVGLYLHFLYFYLHKVFLGNEIYSPALGPGGPGGGRVVAPEGGARRPVHPHGQGSPAGLTAGRSQ